MAQSRLEKVGTIFTRVRGLLRAGAMKPMDKPLWYDVYETFPPKLEPHFDRPAPDIKIRDIFYEEDIVRAKYHKSVKVEMIGLNNRKESSTQQFIQIYNDLKAQGALDEEQIFNTAKDILTERRKALQWETKEAVEDESESKVNLMADFKEAQESRRTKQHNETNNATPKQTKKPLDIKTLFEE